MAQTSFNSRDNFATSLQQYDTAIPLRTQFIAFFDNIPAIVNTSNLQGVELIQGDKGGWNIDTVKSILVDRPENSQKAGCIFVGGASIPSENLNSSSATIENNRGFLQGTILEGRDAYASNQLTIQFRETNSSFTDLILRPWLIMAAHRGFVARPVSESIKTNITIIQFGKFETGKPSTLRKVWKYYDCVPTAVDTRTLTYADEGLDAFNVTFAYDNYNMQINRLSTDNGLSEIDPSRSKSLNIRLGIGTGSVLGVGGLNGIVAPPPVTAENVYQVFQNEVLKLPAEERKPGMLHSEIAAEVTARMPLAEQQKMRAAFPSPEAIIKELDNIVNPNSPQNRLAVARKNLKEIEDRNKFFNKPSGG